MHTHITPPSENINEVNYKNLPLLKEDDDLFINIMNTEEPVRAVDFITSVQITRPTITLNFIRAAGITEEDRAIISKISDTKKKNSYFCLFQLNEPIHLRRHSFGYERAFSED